VVVAGNNLIDASTAGAISDASDAPSQRLAGRVAVQSGAAGFGVIDAGIQANQVISDGNSSGGVSLLARLDRDILAEPNVGTVIIDEGLEDLLQGAGGTLTAGNLADAYQALEGQLNAFGINVIIAALTPCAGYVNSTAGDSCSTGTASVDAGRQDVNPRPSPARRSAVRLRRRRGLRGAAAAGRAAGLRADHPAGGPLPGADAGGVGQ
jgi:hypothetical protein